MWIGMAKTARKEIGATSNGNLQPISGESGKKSDEIKEKRLRVFIAEDSQLVREHLVDLLTLVKGVQVVGAAQTANASIRGIQSLMPDVVILDFQLHDGNGLDVLKSIKQPDTQPLVMMLTNYAYPQYRERCMQWGANYFFDKSQDFEQIVAICQQLLSRTEVLAEMNEK